MTDSLSLVTGGEACFAVYIDPPQDGEAIGAAILELREHLEACLAVPMPWFVRNETDPSIPRLVLHLDVLADELGEEAFELAVTDQDVTLRARTPAAMRHAVCHFLETAFDVRWLWPGRTGTVTPRARDVALPIGTRRHEPSWRWRRLFLGGSFWKEDDPFVAEQKFGGLSPANMRQWQAWQRRARLGGLGVADGHRWSQICSPLDHGKDHPEYFALVGGERDTGYRDGKHGNQPCTSSEAVIDHTAGYVNAALSARPELDVFSIAVNDGKGLCECEGCRAVDVWAGEGARTDGGFEAITDEAGPGTSGGRPGRAVTDRMLLFANRIAERVGREHPDRRLMTLIYGDYRRPPRRVELDPRIIAQFCSMSWRHTLPETHAREMTTFAGLADRAEHLGIYDYFINGTNGSLPRGFARTFDRAIKGYHERGGRYFATQAGTDFATNGFAYYLAARLLWDTGLEVDDVLEDYCRRGFGDAAEPVHRYIEAYLDRWECTAGEHADKLAQMDELAGVLYPAAWRADRRAELDEALARASTEADRARVGFLVKGLDFLDRLVEACEAARTGAPDYPARHAELMDWADAHRDGFWFSAMWFDYQRLIRGGRLGQTPPTVPAK